MAGNASSWDWLGKLSELRASHTPAVLVTVTNIKGSVPRAPGAKMIVLGGGEFFGTIGGGRLEQLAIEEAQQCLNGGPSTRNASYPLAAKAGQCCGGSVEVFMEAVNVSPTLYIYGAGHVGQALARAMLGTPFDVHVIDPRAQWLGKLPSGVVAHEAEWEDFNDDAVWSGARTYVAVMTHRHDDDEAIIADVLKRDTHYVGLIGSKNKWARFRERLGDRGTSVVDLDRVHCPIGVDLGGGKEPQTVAISIAAQLLQTHFADREEK